MKVVFCHLVFLNHCTGEIDKLSIFFLQKRRNNHFCNVQSGEVVCECQPCWRLLLSTLQNAREGDQGSDRGVLPGEFGGDDDCNQRNIVNIMMILCSRKHLLNLWVTSSGWFTPIRFFLDNYSSKEIKWCVLIR